MLAQRHYPEYLNGEALDQYLEKGWFRIGQSVFTTNFLHFNNQYYSALWLRISFQNYRADKREQKICRLCSGFSNTIGKATITAEKENLYEKYRSSISFNPAASLAELLYGSSITDVYNTHEVLVYDGNRLIACGFFDIGHSSAAGINSFYDPDYKKFSLGKYLIYLKIQFCINKGLSKFYPGYFAPGYKMFDYKLQIGTEQLQFYNFASDSWLPIAKFSEDFVPLWQMKKKLEECNELFARSGIISQVVYYEFFEANLYPELQDEPLLDYPVMLLYKQPEDSLIVHVIIYDFKNSIFVLQSCVSIWRSNLPQAAQHVYSTHLLKKGPVLFSSKDPMDMVAIIKTVNNARLQA